MDRNCISSQKIHLKTPQEKEAVPQQRSKVHVCLEKVIYEGKCSLEMTEEEKVPQYKFKVRSGCKKFIAEKESRVETKKKAVVFEKVPL